MSDVTEDVSISRPLDRPGPRGEDEPREDTFEAGRPALVNKDVGAPADTDLEEDKMNCVPDVYFKSIIV